MQDRHRLLTALISLVSLSVLVLLIPQREDTTARTAVEAPTGTPLNPGPAQPVPVAAVPEAAHPVAAALMGQLARPRGAEEARSVEPAQLDRLRGRYARERAVPERRFAEAARELWLAGRTVRVGSGERRLDGFAQTGLSERGTRAYIVQSDGYRETLRAELEADGGRVLAYIPNNAYLVELDAMAHGRIGERAEIQYLGALAAKDKVEGFLPYLAGQIAGAGRIAVRVQGLAPEDMGQIAAAVRALGGKVERVIEGGGLPYAEAVVPLSAVAQLAERPEVQWIEESVPLATSNNVAQTQPLLNSVAVRDNWGLSGAGQIVGHGDSGLSTGDPATLHPDFRGRTVLLASARTTADDLNGHGTHTAGSILGNGHASGGRYAGTAPAAQLVHQSLGIAENLNAIVIDDTYALYATPYHAYGARLRNDSWGSNDYGAYTLGSQLADAFIWEQPDYLVVTSAGNSGIDSDADGRIDPTSTGSPGTAKNVLTVGAAESDRPYANEGYRFLNYGAYGALYPAEPIRGDYFSEPLLSGQGMAAFSSRGPTRDGRIKPDVVAPGTNILSTQTSSATGRAWGAYPDDPAYCYMGGTSMSSPLTAGTAALVREYCQVRAGIAAPSSALLRAIMVGGARSLAPGQYGAGPFREIPVESPNNVEGWGQPDLRAMLHPQGQMLRLRDGLQLLTGEVHSEDIAVVEGGKDFVVALAWVDYPAAVQAGVMLVNDLDLRVIAPDGTVHYGNGGGSSGLGDRLNPLETVRIAAAAAGNYRVEIAGVRIPYPRGIAGYYVRGAIEAMPLIVHTAETAMARSANDTVVIEFRIQSRRPLTTEEIGIEFRQNGGAVERLAAEAQGDGLYRVEVPLAAETTAIEYALSGSYAGSALRQPAAGAWHHSRIGNLVRLQVTGSAEGATYPDPWYGEYEYIAGSVVEAQVYRFRPKGARSEALCTGWTGSGSVPLAGEGDSLQFVIEEDSTLHWQFGASEHLVEVALRDAGGNVMLTSWVPLWVAEGAALPPLVLQPSINLGGPDLYFAGWTANGERWPTVGEVAEPNVQGYVVTGAVRLTADYLAADVDSNANDIPDYYELRYFGNLGDADFGAEDLDEDGWSNTLEYYDGTNPRDADAVPLPPEVVVADSNAVQNSRTTWYIVAEIHDSSRFIHAEVEWWSEAEPTVRHRIAMQETSEGRYMASLEPPENGTQTIGYEIVANDAVSLIDGAYPATRTPARRIESGLAALAFRGIEGGALQLVNRGATGSGAIDWGVENGTQDGADYRIGYAVPGAFGLEDAANWDVSGTGAWVRSTRTGRAGPLWYSGDEQTRTYAPSTLAQLTAPPVRVEAGMVFGFWHWLAAEPQDAINYWDGGVLEISVDGGLSYVALEPEGGYPHKIVPNEASPFEGGRGCFGSTGGAWLPVVVDLAAYVGEDVRIRFSFGADQYTEDEGWYISTPHYFVDAARPDWLSVGVAETGTLAAGAALALGLTVDYDALEYGEFAQAIVRVEGAAGDAVVHAVAAERANRLEAIVNGPGHIVLSSEWFIGSEPIESVIAAAPGYRIARLEVNGVAVTGYADGAAVERAELLFSNAYIDQRIEAWFELRDWRFEIADGGVASTPMPGDYRHPHGTALTVSLAQTEVYDGALTRARCTGWQLVTANGVVAEGTTGVAQIVVTADARLEWLWETAHLVVGTVLGKGTVTPQGAWIAAGGVGEVEAAAAPAYVFSEWLGDTAHSERIGQRLLFPVTAPRSLIAAFTQYATENGLVPYTWLDAQGIGGDLEAAVLADPDSDAFPTAAEYHAGTDPFDGSSFFKIAEVERVERVYTLRWQATAGRRYTIYGSADLENFDVRAQVTAPTDSVEIAAEGDAPLFFIIEAAAME